MTAGHLKLLRASLIAVWLGTAAVSLIDAQDVGRTLLQQSSVTSEPLLRLLILGGSTMDVALGLLLWCKPSRPTYSLALAVLALMTAAATWVAPALWLDPLGPLLKNLPIAAILLVMLQTESSS